MLDHAVVGGDRVHLVLTSMGYPQEFAEHVRQCIRTHRFRRNDPPASIEAKILFDADKLDVTGALGIARTLMYKGNMTEPIYTKLSDGTICDGTGETGPSFFREYKFKLEKLYDKFYTTRGAEMARQRQSAAAAFYESLYREVSTGYAAGSRQLQEILEDA